MRIYLCHSDEDIAIAQGLATALAETGQITLVDREAVRGSANWEAVLEKEVGSADALVILWSQTAAKSPLINRELTTGLLRNRPILYSSLDEEPPSPLLDGHAARRFDVKGSVLTEFEHHLGLTLDEGKQAEQVLTYDQSRKQLRERIREQHARVSVLGHGQEFPLGELYVPLKLRRSGSKGAVEDELFATKLLDLPAKGFVILGLPGTGKSTLMKYLELHIATERPELLPLRIRIAELMQTSDGIQDFAHQSLTGLLGRRPAQLIADDDSFCRENTILLMDGLDELMEVDRREFLKRLASFRTANPDSTVVLTSRAAGFDGKPFETFLQFQLQQLSDADIERYVWTVCREPQREGVWDRIHNDSRLLKLARVPFLLAMMCASPEALGSRAAQRATLLESCIRYLLKQLDWDEAGPGRPRPDEEMIDTLEQALTRIAVRFFKLDAQETFKEEEILFVIRSIADRASTLQPIDIVERIVEYTGLLQRSGSTFSFVHRSIWEYFVAVGMRQEPLENLLERASSPLWEEPIRLYVGLTPERDLRSVLEGLWHRNKALALRAMTEFSSFPDEILGTLLEPLSRDERIRLVLQLGEVVATVPDGLDARRMVTDTLGALMRAERDCEVIYYALRLLEEHRDPAGGDECQALIGRILDVDNTDRRRHELIGSSEHRFEVTRIEGGKFVMGTDDHARTPDERPAHEVRLSTFWMGTYPITNSVYYKDFKYAVDRRDERSFEPNQPVTAVTWFEANVFARWLGCALPTEAQWEYAARAAGADDERLFSQRDLDAYAWNASNAGNVTHDVGQLNPNSFGLYDMLGNVREWCRDFFEAGYYEQCKAEGEVVDPGGPEEGSRNSLRGGCFDWNSSNLFPTYRNYNPSSNSYYANGFRLVYEDVNPGLPLT